jgi:hypothetical protein
LSNVRNVLGLKMADKVLAIKGDEVVINGKVYPTFLNIYVVILGEVVKKKTGMYCLIGLMKAEGRSKSKEIFSMVFHPIGTAIKA